MQAAALIAESHEGDVREARALIGAAVARAGDQWISSVAIAEALVGALLDLSLHADSAPRVAAYLRRLAAAIEEPAPPRH